MWDWGGNYSEASQLQLVGNVRLLHVIVKIPLLFSLIGDRTNFKDIITLCWPYSQKLQVESHHSTSNAGIIVAAPQLPCL